MYQIKRNLSAIKKELTGASGFFDQSIGASISVDKQQISRVEKKLGREIPEPMLAFFKEANGLRLIWSCSRPDLPGTITGKSEIRALELVFDHNVMTVDDQGQFTFVPLPHTVLSEQKEKALRKPYVLDDLGYGNYVVFTLAKDQDEPTLYLLTSSDRLMQLDLTFAEYIDALFETRGLYLWQQYRTTPEDFAPDTVTFDNFHANAQVLFPDCDLAPFADPPSPLPESRFNTVTFNNNRTDYAVLFDEKVAHLKKKGGMKVSEYERNPGAPAAAFARARAALGHELPESMIVLYGAVNGMRLQWEGKQSAGQIILLPIEEVLAGRRGGERLVWNEDRHALQILAPEAAPDEELPFPSDLRPIQVVEGVAQTIAVQFSSGGKEPRMFLLDRNDLHPLPFDVATYLQGLLEFLGLDYWYYLALGREDTDVNGLTIIEHIRERFPDADPEQFFP